MRLLIILLTAVLLLFQYDLWFGKNGYLDYQKATEDVAHYKKENQKLFQRNQEIKAEIQDLKNGINAIQERARFQYEMVKPDETFYRIVQENK